MDSSLLRNLRLKHALDNIAAKQRTSSLIMQIVNKISNKLYILMYFFNNSTIIYIFSSSIIEIYGKMHRTEL